MGPGLVDTPAAAGVVRLPAEMTAARAQDDQVLLAVAQIDTDGDAIAAGYRSTKRFLQDALRINPAEAARLVARAAALTPRTTLTGQPLPPTLPATAQANAAGLLIEGHLGVITDTIERLSCATMRPVISPAQLGGTRREVSGSDGSPGAERLRGQEHARKAAVASRRMERSVAGPARYGESWIARSLISRRWKFASARKTPVTGAAPCTELGDGRCNLRGCGAMLSEGIQGDVWET